MSRRAPSSTLLLDLIFAALADATRRSIIEQLRKGEATVSEVAAPHAMSLPAVSKHLRVLEDAGLLRRRVEGRSHLLTVNAKPLAQATDWLERQRRFWEGSFDRLATLLEDPDPKPASPTPTPPKPKPKR
jgi:DNA-binding transcriptional ArsR family regulator